MLSRVARPALLLRVEGGVLLTASLAFYSLYGESWILFALLLLAPDLSMLGYLAGATTGAATYNLFHNYVLPTALGGYALLSDSSWCLSLALIWLAHIGMDRLIGYGLKYPAGFKDTHLGRV